MLTEKTVNKLNKMKLTTMARLATCCEYIAERHNILILVATEREKTYIACALGMATVRNFLQIQICQITLATHRVDHCQRQRDIPQSDSVAQETFTAHFR